MKLDQTFLNKWSAVTPDWGPVGEFVYLRTYSRDADNGQWWRTCQRVVEGIHQVLFEHCIEHNRPYSPAKAQHSAQRMFELMFEMKFLPPGRGIWTMGTEVIAKKGGAAANNCGFVSTAGDVISAACWLMDMSMLGVGVGFDLLGAGQYIESFPQNGKFEHSVVDSREGWVQALRSCLMLTYKNFDYSQIRPAGAPIETFGGTASGPEPLRELIEWVIANVHPAKTWSKTLIVDLMNMIGRCVVAGNVRRSAEIALGDASDEFLELKNYEKHPEENAHHRWASNNSVVASVGDDYSAIAKRIAANGEPGVFWLDNAQRFGRMGRTPDNADNRASGCNPCVPAETLILTQTGYQEIGSIVGEPAKVWNGFEWSHVSPRKTGSNQPLVKVQLNNGRDLVCTPAHEFVLHGGERVKAIELVPNSALAKFEMPTITAGQEWDLEEVNPYTQGFFSGDGQDKGILLYGEKKKLIKHMTGTTSGKVLKGDRQWLGVANHRTKDWVPMNYCAAAKLEWLAGLLDSDGNVIRNPNSVSLQIGSIDKKFLQDVQLMLTTLGVQAKINKSKPEGSYLLPDGKGSAKEYNCQQAYRLLIGTADTVHLVNLGLVTYRLVLDKLKPNRCARRFVRVVDVQPLERAADVYCFTEHLNHTGTFNGIVTGQCSEQTLEHRELCCLVETFPSRHDSFYEYQETLKYAYLYAKAVTLIETHDQATNEIIRRNRRIGCSMSGVQEAVARFGTDKFYRKWCRGAYKHIRTLDDRYSEWLDINRSIKVTSIKPSGTVSLLPGVSPGVHFPIGEYYYRCIRVASDSNYVPAFKSAGYRVVDLAPNEPGTTVVYFPVKQANYTRSETEVSLWEQFEHVRMLQHYYADNQVSATLKFHPAEAAQIEPLLNIAQFSCKSLSMLPHSDHGFEHAPYQKITKKEYDSAIANLKPVDYSRSTHEVTDAYCDSEGCEIPKGEI